MKKVEQINGQLILKIDNDKILSQKRKLEIVEEYLGKENCSILNINNKKILIYANSDKKIMLLIKQITYLGHPHPIYKKRIQIPNYYKEIYKEFNEEYDIRILGIYSYEKDVIFADFDKTNYIMNRLNNSSAHVYTNDLFQTFKYGYFKKIDKNKNIINLCAGEKLKIYLDDIKELKSNKYIDIIEKFNCELKFKNWILCRDAVKEMYDVNWKDKNQGEWPGFLLEKRFHNFVNENGFQDIVNFQKNKTKGDLDFDLIFEKGCFYGDLKASDILSNETIGNDQEATIRCLNDYEKFWYVVYEHNTIKDKNMDYVESIWRNHFLYDNDAWPKNKPFDVKSYSTRLKHSVSFEKMYVIEINKINYTQVLSDFKQGKQPNGSSRNLKFKIKKSDMENFIIYRYYPKGVDVE